MKHNKIAVITGANSGVGFEISKGMLKDGYHVVMACRNSEKAALAKEQLLSEFRRAEISIFIVDISDFASIREFAQRLKAHIDHIDILINNAGILLNKSKTTPDGTELQFATNHLGHFLLVSLLIDLMPDSQASRVISLSSIAHKKAKINFNDLNCENQPNWDAAYAQSKLACLMFSDQLNRMLQASGKKIISVAAHPGGTDTGLFENMSPLLMTLLRFTFVPLFLHSTFDAAKPALMAALSQSVNGGEYYGPTGLLEMKGPPGLSKRSKYSQDVSVAERLWELSEKLTQTHFRMKQK